MSTISKEHTANEEFTALVRSRIEALRPKLLDLSRRNPLIATKFSTRSNSHIRVVDELPDVLAYQLGGQTEMRLMPLPALNDDPRDEHTPRFRNTLAKALLIDEHYLKRIDDIDQSDDRALDLAREAERELRDRLRIAFKMPPRQTSDNVSLADHARVNGISPSYNLPEPSDEHEDGRHQDEQIQTLILPDDLERKMNALMTKCRTWMQETGINVLHVAFGFLEWSESGASPISVAPLVLLPIEMTKRKTKDGPEYWLGGKGDELETNAVIAEKLRLEFGLNLPTFIGGSIEEHLAEISKLAPRNLRWRVLRQVAIGVFPSARMAMYHDLEVDKGAFDGNVILANLLAGNPSGNVAQPFADEYEVDQPEIERKVPALVLDADSSQFSTIVDIADGKNLSVEGPPGSGKSQTIVNTIASALFDGKKVLFVAEKMAALNVVRSRLEAVGLGEFILPLQADRSSRERVIRSIKERIEMPHVSKPESYAYQLDRFQQARAELANYVEVMSAAFENTGFTVYEILGRAIASTGRLEDQPQTLQRPELDDPAAYHRDRIQLLLEHCRSVEEAWRAKEAVAPYWNGIKIDGVDRFITADIQHKAKSAAVCADQVAKARKSVLQLGFKGKLSIDQLSLVKQVCDTLGFLEGKFDSCMIERLLSVGKLKEVEQFLSDCSAFREEEAALGAILSEPTDPAWHQRLMSLQTLCRDSDLETADSKSITCELIAAREQLATLQQIRDSIQPLLADMPAIAEWPFKWLAQARQLLASTERGTLALRRSSLAEPNAILALAAAIDMGRSLEERRNRLEKTVSCSIDVPVHEVRAHAGTLRGGGHFRLLFAEYRRAKKFYLSIAQHSKFDNSTAAGDLTDLAALKTDESRFCTDPINRDLFGVHFRGIETNFGQFEHLRDYFDEIDRRFPGTSKRSLRQFLKSGDVDLLMALPETIPMEDGDFCQLQTAIAKQESRITQLFHVNSQLESLLQGVNDTASLEVGELDQLAERAASHARRKAVIDECPEIRALLGEQYQGSATRVEAIEKDLIAARALQHLKHDDMVMLSLIEQSRLGLASERIDTLLREESSLETAISQLSEITGIASERFHDGRSPEAMVANFEEAAADVEGLAAHARFFQTRSEMQELGGDWIIETLLSEGQPLDGLDGLVEAVIFQGLAARIFQRHRQVLSRFSGQKLNTLRDQLSSSDRAIIKLSRQHLRAKIQRGAKPPEGKGYGPKSTWTELALLHNEINKKRRRIAVRELTKRAGTALQELKPCWMLSPLSVAQYLARGSIEFDLVIIDEASQMPPEDALGALARGRQVMVVGDTNQLPPTSFFKKMVDDEEQDDDEAVLEESILEMANAAFRPARRLRWHYRSRHAALIQFSNQLVYNNDLVIFPSATEGTKDRPVSLHKVEGLYASGTNAAECEAMVKAALDFMKRYPDWSLGLVVLNQKQRDLLIDAMEQAFDNDKDAAQYRARWREKNDGLEEFFIKNLENVQGDERDVIFIGTVYGPEQPGAPVAQRFGPINGLAGKRRLNVLFSRAKQKIVTFSSMTSDNIKADETGNQGAYMLKSWLEYSASGLLPSQHTVRREPDSPFEEFVIAQIQAMGCEAVPQVGAAGFFIDIAVKHPKWPYGYVLGVECDGAAYHSSKSARDRDRLRQEILEGLGWHLHRIWSTDWFNNPSHQAEILRRRIAQRIEDLARQTKHQVGQPTSDPDTATSQELKPVLATKAILTPPTEDKSKPAVRPPGIKPGDRVRVRYLSGTGATLDISLTDQANDPEHGLINSTEPLGAALLGAEEGEEIEVLVGSYVRRALVERVTGT